MPKNNVENLMTAMFLLEPKDEGSIPPENLVST
jgi:hypothetical protein